MGINLNFPGCAKSETGLLKGKPMDTDRIEKDTRYFIDIEVGSLKVVRHGSDHKENLNKGRQGDPRLHRLFLTKGQYNKFVARCKPDEAACG